MPLFFFRNADFKSAALFTMWPTLWIFQVNEWWQNETHQNLNIPLLQWCCQQSCRRCHVAIKRYGKNKMPEKVIENKTIGKKILQIETCECFDYEIWIINKIFYWFLINLLKSKDLIPSLLQFVSPECLHCFITKPKCLKGRTWYQVKYKIRKKVLPNKGFSYLARPSNYQK